MSYMKEFYEEAREQLEEELGREPTDDEVSKRAQDLCEDAMSRAYDLAKDRRKYGDE